MKLSPRIAVIEPCATRRQWSHSAVGVAIGPHMHAQTNANEREDWSAQILFPQFSCFRFFQPNCDVPTRSTRPHGDMRRVAVERHAEREIERESMGRSSSLLSNVLYTTVGIEAELFRRPWILGFTETQSSAVRMQR